MLGVLFVIFLGVAFKITNGCLGFGGTEGTIFSVSFGSCPVITFFSILISPKASGDVLQCTRRHREQQSSQSLASGCE